MAKKSSRRKATAPEPRRKTVGDEIYNLRRRLKRRAARERERGRTMIADRLEAMAAKTYAQKGQTGNVKRLENVRENIDAARETLISYLRTEFRAEQAQKRARERQATIERWRSEGINVPKTPREQAEEKRPSRRDDFNMKGPEDSGAQLTDTEPEQDEGVRWANGRIEDNLSRAEAQALFAYTRGIWQGAPRAEREEIIMKHFQASSIEEVFARTLGRFEATDAEGELIELAEEERYQYYRSASIIGG